MLVRLVVQISTAKPWLGDEERAAVLRVLDSGNLVQGPEVAALEGEWAAACSARHAIAVSSGTTALQTALLAHGIGPGDEVITTPFTFIATAHAIVHVGATPVFIDIDEATFNLDPALLESALSPRTKAIVPVHLFGQPCDLDAIDAIAGAHGVAVIEDAAQAMGSSFGGRPTGGRHTTTFSLYATKNATSGGEGGMVTTQDAAVAERCRLLRSHGREGKEEPRMLGFNFRMSEIHAAIGRVQLAKLGEANRRRAENARILSSELDEALAILPTTAPNRQHVWHQYTVRLRSGRDAAVDALRADGVSPGVFYRTPAHRYPHLREAARVVGTLRNAERAADQVLSLPAHPSLDATEREHVVRAANRAFAR